MENINFNQNRQEDIDSLREKAVFISKNLVNKQKDFIEEVGEILKKNDTLQKAYYKYGDVEEACADFRVTPWGIGNLDTQNLDFKGIIEANVEHKPNMDVLHNIEAELDSRMNQIKEALNSFSGTEVDAFDLVQKIHKEQILKPLNSRENPILEKIS